MQPQRAIPWNLVAIWLLVSALAVLACSLTFISAHLKDEYLPVGNDAFYHARRILDTVHDSKSFYEFDIKIHAPEGSLLTWPWGYDYVMAALVRFGLWLGLNDNPVAILIWIPVAAVPISIALMLAIARQLSLSKPISLLGGLCLALAPTTQLLHGAGAIDHHYAELMFILAALAGGLGWRRNPDKPLFAAATALSLGLASSVQNGLFILQLPLLAATFAWWLQHKSMPFRSSVVFAVTLVAATLAILIPSVPFRTGEFQFYLLSWFHLYISICTGTTMVMMSKLRATRTGIATLVIASLALLLPIFFKIPLAQGFIAGTPVHLQGIGEMQPPLTMARTFGTIVLTNFYSYLILIAPLTFLLCAVQCWRERNDARLLFWITSVMGLALLAAQLRMHYFGSFALYLPWLVMLQQWQEGRPQFEKKPVLLASVALLLLYFPSLRHQLAAPAPKANDLSFENIRPLLGTLHDACAKDPGIVLADSDIGHYIRYYSDCSVIANNFLLTPQHMQKVDEQLRLMSLTAKQLEVQAPQVKYVLLRPFKIGPGPNGKIRYTFIATQPLLANDLLLGSEGSVPPEFELLDEVRFPEINNAPYATLYKIHRTAASPEATSAITVSK